MTGDDDEDYLLTWSWRRIALHWLSLRPVTDRWSYLSADERQERRDAWPRWRRAVRPIGVAAFWAGAVLGFIFDAQATVIRAPLAAIVASCAVIGFPDWWRDREAARAVRATERTGPSPRSH